MDQIQVTLKLYSGIHKEINLENYDPEQGLLLHVKPGTSLRKILIMAGFKKPRNYIYFSEGERISTWSRIKYSREISCLKHSGGG